MARVLGLTVGASVELLFAGCDRECVVCDCEECDAPCDSYCDTSACEACYKDCE